MGDAKYASLLLDLMRTRTTAERKETLLVAASRLSPRRATEVIRPLVQSMDPNERQDAAKALEATEVPEALPILVNMLTDSSERVRETAGNALITLTRRTSSPDGLYWSGPNPGDDLYYWKNWLQSNPEHPIHPMRECPQKKQR